MAWPLSQDFNEAVQNPSTAFRDADLKGGRVTATPLGVPLPRSGNYADVYQVVDADGRAWALKCFTRAVDPNLQVRYAAIAGHLAQANLPFTVGFEFLPDGVRVKGKAYPALKMQWVEGLALNTFVKENLGRATVLEASLSLWVRLCRRLRETGMAHCDLQHGNVILVPGEKANSLGLKLVDYDGIFVPALAGQNPGEAGHASFQHPQRVVTNDYSADLDRFPHLVVATALRGLLVGGKTLWDKYDTGDNLILTSKDFTSPQQSRVMRELWDTGDPFTVGLLSHLVIAASKPLAATPWLDTLMPEGRPPMLTPSQERQAMKLLGLPVQGAVPQPQVHTEYQVEEPELGFDTESPARVRSAKASAPPYVAIGVVAIALVAVGVAVFAFSGRKNSGQAIVQASAAPASATPVVVPPEVVVEKSPAAVETKPSVLAKEGKILWSVNAGDVSGSVSYSHDGTKLIVPMAKTGQIRIYDTKTGGIVATFADHPAGPVQAAPLPDGKVISVGSDPVAIVWDESTGKAVARAFPHGISGVVDLLQTDREGRYALVAAGSKASVVDLDENKDAVTVDLVGSGLPGRAAAMLAPDGSALLSLALGGLLVTNPLPSGPATQVKLAIDNAAIIVAWSPEKNLAVLRSRLTNGETDVKLFIVDVITGETVTTLTNTTGSAAFTAAGTTLVVATRGDALHALDPRTGVVQFTVPSKSASLASDLAVSPITSTVAFVSVDDHKLSLAILSALATVEVAPPTVVKTPARPPVQGGGILWSNPPARQSFNSLGYSHDGTKVFTSFGPSGVQTFDAKTGALVASFTGHKPTDRVFAAPLPGGRMVSIGVEPQLMIWDESTGKILQSVQVRGPVGPLEMLQTDRGGKYAAVATGLNGSIIDLAQDKEMLSLELPVAGNSARSAMRLAPDGSRVLAITSEKTLKTQPLPSGPATEVKLAVSIGLILDWHPALNLAVIHGRTAAGSMEPVAHVVNTTTGQKVSSFTVGNGRAAFTPDGRHVVVVAPNGVAYLDVQTGLPVALVPLRMNNRVVGLAVSPDGATALFMNLRMELVLAASAFAPAIASAPDPVAIPVPAVKARKPLPSEAALKAAQANVKDIFKDLYAKRLAADRRILAGTLLKTASETANDPVAKYVLLKEAQALAIELNDTLLGSKAIDQIDADYEVDGTALRIALLEKIATTATKADVLRNLSETCSEMVEDLAEKSEFEKALKLAAVGVEALRHANLPLLARDLENRQVQLKRQREAYEPVKAALAGLKTNPADAAAQLTVGRYRCFVLSRWAEGLPNLAAGTDVALKAAATLDASVDAEVTDMKRAEAWWAWGQAQAEPEKTAALGRAKYWYAKIIADGKAGLDRVTAESRLAFKIDGVEYRPGLVLEASPTTFKPKNATRVVKLVTTPDVAGADYKPLSGNVVVLKVQGFLLPPAAGRYKFTVEGNARVSIKVFGRGEEKTIINILDPTLTTNKKEAFVVLPAKPVPMQIEMVLSTTGATNVFALKWQRPGGKVDEPVPTDLWFHTKAQEVGLTEK